MANKTCSNGSTGSPDGLDARSLGSKLTRYIIFLFFVRFSDSDYSSSPSVNWYVQIYPFLPLLPVNSAPVSLNFGLADFCSEESIVGFEADVEIARYEADAGLAGSALGGLYSLAMRGLCNKDSHIVGKDFPADTGDIEYNGEIPANEVGDQIHIPCSYIVNSDIRD
ncbi:hypothetical protein ACOSQ2_013127 [Xanthoceras sorbifolium]